MAFLKRGKLEMSEYNVKMEAADLGAAVVLFAAGCGIGVLCESLFGDSFAAFSVPAMSTLAGGEWAWSELRKRVREKLAGKD